MTDSTMSESPLTVRLLQGIVPRYRLPVFEALGRAPGITLEVWASFGTEVNSIDSVHGSAHFRAVEMKTITKGPVHWQEGAMDAATKGPCDVLIASWNSRDVGLPRVLSAARRAGRATLLWGHGFGKTVPLLGGWLRDRLIRRADGVIFYGPAVRDRYIARGYPREKLFVAPNAIDQVPVRRARRRWLADPELLAGFRREHGLGEDPIVVFLSRLEPDKCPDLLIRAAPLVLAQVPNARFVLIGKGRERAALESMAARLGVAGRVHFAGAIFEEDQLAPWCLASSVLVHPGGIGLTLFHAFGFDLPVITTDGSRRHGPEIEMHRPDVNGLLFRDGDVSSLAETIVRVLRDEALRRRLATGAAGSVDAASGRDVEGMVAGFVDAIRSVAARRGGGAVRRAMPTAAG